MDAFLWAAGAIMIGLALGFAALAYIEHKPKRDR
jgi:hypothetical protein